MIAPLRAPSLPAAALALAGIVSAAPAVSAAGAAGGPDAPGPGCFAEAVPAAALPAQPPPVLCRALGAGPGTAVAEPGGWTDDFDHGLSFAGFDGAGYRVFEAVDGAFASRHWRHADHWMVDVAPAAPDAPWRPAAGGAMLRPDASFRFGRDGLAVEAVFAAGHADYANLAAWGELIVTTAPAPTGYRRGGVYGYEMFPGHVTLGCRLQADRHAICSLMDATARSALDGGRLWEMSFFQRVGTEVFGGGPWGEGGEAFRTCAADGVADVDCRDRFRMGLTADALRLDVGGVRYFEQTGLPRLPDELLGGDVYVYLASIVGAGEAEVVRFHWDDVAVEGGR